MNPITQGPHPISFYLTPHKKYNPLDLAYAAGYFDGEGTIYLRTINHGRILQTRLQVTASDYWAVRLYWDLFGGKLSEVSGHSLNIRIFRWYVLGAKVFEPLRAMLPYLRSKDREAKALLASGITIGARGSSKAATGEAERRSNATALLRELKGRGRQQGYPIVVWPVGAEGVTN